MKEFLSKHWQFILILLLLLSISWPLFRPGYFYHHDDLQVMRVFEMRKCFEDLQIPCRWIPDMGFGNGFPLYNYYSALPYYIGGLLTYFLGFMWAAKSLFFFPLVIAAISMYLLVRQLGDKLTGLVAAVLYSFAPYHALDTYVRGAVAESFGTALVPLVFCFSFRLIKKQTKGNFLGLSLSLGAFLLSHNIMTMLFTPIILLWIIFWLYFEGVNNIKPLLLSVLLGFGLAAFFIIPAFFEKNLVDIETLTQGGSDFRGHFVSIYQLFLDRKFEYGFSQFGPRSTISFQIGWPHWWLAVLLPVAIAFSLLNRGKYAVEKVDKKIIGLTVLLGAIFLGSLFMMHNRSAFIWERIQILQFTQFPWRFLGVAVFCASMMGSILTSLFKGKAKVGAAFLIIILTVVLNWSFFRPKDFYLWMTDKEKLSGVQWEFQQKAGLLDYLPKTAKAPQAAAPNHPEIITGEVQIVNFINRSNRFSFGADVKKTADIEVPVFDFPNWQIFVNNQPFPHSHQNYLGRIELDLTPGVYQVVGKFTNTPVRSVSNLITLLSLLSVITIFIYGKKFERKI